MSNPRSMYAKLDESTPMFTITPGKNCRLFPYLWSKDCAAFYGPNGNPADNPFRCKAQGPVDPNQQYLGFPVNFEYSLSGEKNCNTPTSEYPPTIGTQLQTDQVKEPYQCPCANSCPCHKK